MRIARFICSLFLAVGLLAIPAQSRAQVAVGISVQFGPPVLPIYAQPICPGPGYIWTPGYWAYGPDGYFWVPGTWAYPPKVGLLWTPGYWAFEDDLYVWSPGYWGPEVGFYGGLNYGFGYTGVGFFGGYWRGGNYYYNRSVTNVDVTVVHNTYNTMVINNNSTRVSFNGGRGGTTASPTSREMEAARQHHLSMTSEQTQHQQTASSNRTLLASVNHGRPDIAATPWPGEFHGRGGGETGRHGSSNRPFENQKEASHPGRPPENGRAIENRPLENPRETNHPRKPSAANGRVFEDRPPSSRPSTSSRVNPGLEQKQQRELEKLRRQQDSERQKVQQRHVQEQQKLERQRPNDQRQRQQEQLQRRQQQQVEQMQQKHAQQSQKIQEHQQREAQRQQNKEPKGGRPPEHQR